MKKVSIIGLLVFITIIMSTIITVYASAGTVSVTPSKTELNPGDTFKITLSGDCDEGINGLEALISYEDSIFELVEAKVADDKWINLGQNTEEGVSVTIICNSPETIKNANIFIATFKVKENVKGRKTSNINVTGIELYSDESKTYNTSSKTITFTIGKTEEEEPTTPKEYTVTFNSNGGSAVSSQVVVEGNKVSKPTNPTKEGYTFGGWHLDAELKTEYDFDKTITSDITIYAKWNKKAEEEPEKSNIDTSSKDETKKSEGTKTNNKATETKNNDKYNKEKLPQTGENDYIIVVGVLLVISTIVFYILYKKHRIN